MRNASPAAIGLGALIALAIPLLAGPALAAQDTAHASGRASTRTLDDFDAPAEWSAHPSDGVSLRISRDAGRSGGALRLDYDFHGGGGYAIARRSLAIHLPDNYRFAFWVRGTGGAQNLEFKLVDPSGDNVWWTNRRDFRFPREWERVVTKKRHVEFAWGPAGGGEMRRVAAVELAITAGSGGRGTVWLDDFTLTPLPPVVPYTGTPAVRVSAGATAERVVNGDTTDAWRAPDGVQWLELDFGRARELGGLLLRWAPDDHARLYEVQADAGDGRWETVYAVERGRGGDDPIYLPETEARRLRLRLLASARGRGYALREAQVQPLAWSATPNAFFAAIARAAPRGSYPKYLRDSMSYWTVVGESGDREEGLINEEGMLEVGKGAWSVEPFLWADGRLTTWADARPVQSLARGDLPIPSVRWEGIPLPLTITAVAAPSRPRESAGAGGSTIWTRYRVENPGTTRRRASLLLAIRPLQVNPSWQFLNTTGGVSRIGEMRWDGAAVTVDTTRRLIAATPPSAFGAATFDEGDVTEWLRQGALPPHERVRDVRGWASGALRYDLEIPAGGARDVWVAVPLRAGTDSRPERLDGAGAAAIGDSVLTAMTRTWSGRLDRVRISLPDEHGAELARTMRSMLAYILVNRDGPAIQPGSRSYERSWIRDGSLTSAALLRLGHEAEVRDYLDWYSRFQYANGKVPCCVDARGADPVPENDSHGQLVYLVAEYFRFTHDTARVRRLWPRVTLAVAYMDSLRRSRMTAPYYADSIAFFGLLPQSISHEGYSAKPMHSFWDDAFGYQGVKDAAELALVVGDSVRTRAYAAMRDHFRDAIRDAYVRTMRMHGIDYLAGAVELGDFDATSTTTMLAPAGGEAWLPPEAVKRTFDRYWSDFVARRDGAKAWDAYTPYEHRVVGSFIRLGQPERAHAVLDWFMRDRRPAAWHHWAEVVYRDPATPKFVGDMPHTWVGSDFIRSVLDMFAFERDADSSLVVAAGVQPEWTDGAGMEAHDLRTAYGRLDLAMKREGDAVVARLAGESRIPPGGIVLHAPFGRAPREALVDGRAVPLTRGAVVVRRLPVTVTFRF